MRVLERVDFPVILLSGGVGRRGQGRDGQPAATSGSTRATCRCTPWASRPTRSGPGPPMWRFWRALPPKGKTGVFFGSWYTAPIVDRVYGRIGGAELTRALAEIARFERMLVRRGRAHREGLAAPLEEGAAQALREARGQPGDGVAGDQAGLEGPRALRRASARSASARCARPAPPRRPGPSSRRPTRRYRNLTVGRTLLDAMLQAPRANGQALGRRARRAAARCRPSTRATSSRSSISRGRSPDAQYDKRLPKLQASAQRRCRTHRRFRDRAVRAGLRGQRRRGQGRRRCGA